MKARIVASIWSITALLTGVAGVSNVVLAREVLSPQPDTRAESVRMLAEPKALVTESLGSGTAVDIYRVSCVAECIQADVKDQGGFFDTRFKMEINGSSPGFVGNASAFNPTGGLSNYVEVCSGQNVNSTRRAYVTISEVNARGAERYDTLITCRTATNDIINPTVVKVLDQ